MFKYIKIYSVDIALGAVVGAWFFAQVVRINLPWYIYTIIGLTVWSIYTIDHLVDARKLNDEMGPARYIYHKKYFYPSLAFTVAATAWAFILSISLLPEMLLVYGAYLSGVVVVYFILRLLLKPVFAGLKEFLAAVVYTGGLALPAWFYINSFSFFFLSVVLQFFCLVLANLLICSQWDQEWDKRNSYDSMAITYGRKFISGIIVALIIINILSSATGLVLYEAYYLKIQFAILLMSLALLLIYFFGSGLKEHTQRLMIDSIFFIPLIILLL